MTQIIPAFVEKSDGSFVPFVEATPEERMHALMKGLASAKTTIDDVRCFLSAERAADADKLMEQITAWENELSRELRA